MKDNEIPEDVAEHFTDTIDEEIKSNKRKKKKLTKRNKELSILKQSLKQKK